MRSIPVQCGTIQIASVAGELRHVSVSGLAKARLLWIFRNFSILDFSVLNQTQQQLIAQVWQAGQSVSASDASLEVIGTLEGFSPKLCQLPAPAIRSSQPSTRTAPSKGWRTPAIWTAIGVSLLVCGICLRSKPRWIPQFRVTPVAASNNVRSANTPLARTSAESKPPVAAVPAMTAEAPGFPPDIPSTEVRTTEARPADSDGGDSASLTVKPPAPRGVVSDPVSAKVAAVNTPVSAPASAKVNAPVAKVSAPAAMASAPVSTKVGSSAPGKPEVIVSVSVDSQGRPQTLHVVRGDGKKISAALTAARRWSFQPCSDSAGCEHLLKFTDHGEASTMQMIE